MRLSSMSFFLGHFRQPNVRPVELDEMGLGLKCFHCNSWPFEMLNMKNNWILCSRSIGEMS